jgi:hypothetical protein
MGEVGPTPSYSARIVFAQGNTCPFVHANFKFAGIAAALISTGSHSLFDVRTHFDLHYIRPSSYIHLVRYASLTQGAAPKVKAAKPAMLCHGGTWLVEECLVVIPGWQMAVHG